MKNLPDDVLFNRIKVRLQNFEEQPDEDTWDAIAAKIRTTEPGWIKTVERSTLLLAFLLMLGTRYFSAVQTIDHPLTIVGAEQPSETHSVDARAVVVGPLSSTLPVDAMLPSLLHDRSQADNSERSQRNAMPRHDFARASQQTTMNSSLAIATINARENAMHDSSQLAGESSTGSNAQAIGTIEPNDVNLSSKSDSLINVDFPIHEIPATAAVTKVDSAVPENPIVAPPPQRVSMLRVYAIATPSLTFQHVVPSTSDDATFQGLNSPGVLSRERLSFSFEGGVQYMIAKRLMAFTGLTYYQQSMDLSLEQLKTGSSFSQQGSLDFNVQPSTFTNTISYRMQNIGLAAGLSYVISVGKILHQLGGGLHYEYGLLHRSPELERQTSNNFLSYRIFYRAEYGLNERVSVFIQPSFTRSLLYDEVLDGAIRVKQSRAGIGIGFLYRLK